MSGTGNHSDGESPDAKIRVIVADPHPVVRRGLRDAFIASGDIAAAGEASDAAELLSLIDTVSHDMVTIAMQMPGGNGIDLVYRISEQFPFTKVLVLTLIADGEIARSAFRAGAVGYMLKDAPMERIINAIRTVSSGAFVLDPSIVAAMRKSSDDAVVARAMSSMLSVKEMEIALLVSEGLSNKEIADRIYVSVRTVESHISHILGKTGIDSRTKLALWALDALEGHGGG
ncbi:MAG: response regulator transcription factor [Actinobacteria bacterium]|nr:response regulator transcription factor [Actinomycetota bacterium]MCL5446922.1 response regulator transcription factor [Actinomycetota bacterium]